MVDMEIIIDEIKSISLKFDLERVVLFGSRARGDNSPRSDIDLAIWGLRHDERLSFEQEILENVSTLLAFDFVYIEGVENKALLKEIEKDGIVIYG